MWSWERFDGVVGTIPFGGFVAPDLALIVASIPCQISPDRGAIGPRSNHNREPWSWVMLSRCRPMEIRRSKEFHALLRWEEIGENHGHLMEITRSISIACLMTIERAISVHASAGEPSDVSWWRFRSTVWRQSPQSCTRDESSVVRPMEIRWSQCVHAVLPDPEIVKDCDRPMKPRLMKITWSRCVWFNEDRTLLVMPRGATRADKPVGPPYANPLLTRGAPHGRLHGPAWTPVDTRGLLPCVCALCATCASRGPPAAQTRGLSAASHPLGGPAHHISSRAGPARHVSTCG